MRLAVLGNQPRATPKASHGQSQSGLIQPCLRHTAATRLQGILIRVEPIIEQPIDVPQRRCAALLLDTGRGLGDKEPVPSAHLDITQRDQTIVCLHHAKGTDLEFLGGSANGRQTRALGQLGLVDQLGEVLYQLTDARHFSRRTH
ncbi:hypothetical protein D9M68_839260 [compost metagenome]